MASNMSNCCSVLSIDNITDLDIFLTQLDWDQFVQDDIPTTVFLLLICVLGVLGNLHVFIAFSNCTERSVTVLVKWMAFGDLITSGICVPLEIVQIRYTYTYPSPVLCKITKYLDCFSILFSGILLVFVAVERRQKICKPMNPIALRTTKRLVAFLTIICVLLSIAAAVNYGVGERNTHIPGISGTECRDINILLRRKIAYVTFTGIILVLFTICTTAYIQIVGVIRQRIKAEKKRQNFPNGITMKSVSMETIDGGENIDKSAKPKKDNPKRQYKHSQNLTMMVLMGTVVSFIGYAVRLITKLYTLFTEDERAIDTTTLHTSLVRAYFIHCAVNPIIYTLVDKNLREKCVQFYYNIINCSRENKKDVR